MQEELGDFSEGIESYVVFKNTTIPQHTKDQEYNLATLVWRSLIPEGLSVKGLVVGTTTSKIIKADLLLSTSHDCVRYDPLTQQLTVLRYSCDKDMNGRKSIDVLTEELRSKPSIRIESDVIVDEELAKSRGKKIYRSVEEALEDIKLNNGSQNYLTGVFFGVSNKRIDEDKLENIFTKCLKPDERKPTTELVHRFPDEGYTYIHQSTSIFGGGHSFTKHKSLANSLCGRGEDVANVLRLFAEELKTQRLSLEKRY